MATDEGRVDAAWVIARAPWFIRARVGAGWRPVMHECVEAPQWNRDGDATEALTAAEIAWFNGEDIGTSGAARTAVEGETSG